ncbi:hypothetical protein SLA2020_106470 [Shorea laevis]
MDNPHILVIPYPVQGHFQSQMEWVLRKIGIMWGSLLKHAGSSCPVSSSMLIEKINQTDEDDITSVLADMTIEWGVEVATELGIKGATLWLAATLHLTLIFTMPKLIDDGVIDENAGTPLKHKMIQLSSDSLAMNPSNFAWMAIEHFTTQKIILDLVQRNNIAIKKVGWLLCNPTYNSEAEAFALVSKPPHSVIYVAFGSFTILNRTQFQELALGLELSNRSFLWVVRPNITEGKDYAYPDGFQNRVADCGRMEKTINSIQEGGSSDQHFKSFIKWVKS